LATVRDIIEAGALKNLRLDPLEQQPASTAVGLTPLPEEILPTLTSRKPTLSELFGEEPKSVEEIFGELQSPFTGLPMRIERSFAKGFLGFDPAEALELPAQPEEGFQEIAAEAAGFVVPIGATVKGLSLIPGVKNLFGRITGNVLKRLVLSATRGATIGATVTGVQESTKALITGEDVDFDRITDDALIFGAFDAGFSVLGAAARPLVRAIRRKRWSTANKLFDEIKDQIPEGDRKFGEMFFESVKRGEKPKISRNEAIDYLNVQRLNIANNPVDDLAAFWKEISAPAKFRPSGAKITKQEMSSAKRRAAKNLGIKLVKTRTGKFIAPKGFAKQIQKEARKIVNDIRIQKAREAGIAIRTTPGGRKVPSVRESGPFISAEFANYKNFKDISTGLGGTKDPTRAIQEIDGALSVLQKIGLPGQAGPVEKHALWRTRDMMVKKSHFLNQQRVKLQTMARGISNEDALVANKVLERIDEAMTFTKTSELAKTLGVSEKIAKFAQQSRRYLDELLDAQNLMRKLRNQEPIKRRKFYSPQQLQNMSLWGQVFGVNKFPKHIMESAGLPDFILPNAPFNPRALARKHGLKEFEREMNLKRLLERYTDTAGKDIFNTSIIQNNKAAAQQLRSEGLENSARFIDDWTSEAFADTRGWLDRRFLMNNTARSLSGWFRGALVRTVFPLNIGWGMFIQSSSAALTVTRLGFKNSGLGMIDWLTNPQIRRDIADNAYSFIIKTARSGKITSQDINRGITRMAKIERSPLESMQHAANYFTEWEERHLTGWSVATGLRAGRAKGLRDKALWEFASDAGAKTQSMYNYEDLPGILRNDIVKTVAPFQTFNFEVYNTMKEFMGKTGTPPSTQRERMAWALRFLAGISAVNAIGTAAIGRKPWDFPGSFVPFYSIFAEPIVETVSGRPITSGRTRGLPAPTGIAVQFGQALQRYAEKGDSRPLRNWAIKYIPAGAGIPAGTQTARIVDGIILIADGGPKDASGRLKFPITEPKEKLRTLLYGPFSTKAGQEYLKARERPSLIENIFTEDETESGGRSGRSRSERGSDRAGR
jgi:hypothetical protein